MPSSYVRSGTERSLLLRETSLRHLRKFYIERIRENLDDDSRADAIASMVKALDLHIRLMERIRFDVSTFIPKYWNGRLGKHLPLTPDVLEARRQQRLMLAKSHADEVTKRKSRKAKNN